jgi:hypothetical protein
MSIDRAKDTMRRSDVDPRGLGGARPWVPRLRIPLSYAVAVSLLAGALL